MDVIGYGDADMAIILSVEHLPARDEKVLASSYHLCPGGMVANTIVALSRLGPPPDFMERLGTTLSD